MNRKIEELEIKIDQNNEKMADLIKQVEAMRIENSKHRQEIRKLQEKDQSHG